MKFKLLDKENNLIGEVEILEILQELHLGRINFICCPIELKSLFLKYEQMVLDQVFSLIDEIEDQINAYGLNIDGNEIENVQIMKENKISFKSKHKFL